MLAFLRKALKKIREGYLKEMLIEWKWIAKHFRGYYKGISFFLLSGILSTGLSLASAVASKYLIDAVTGHKSDRIVICAILTVGLAMLSALILNGIGLIKVRIRTAVSNEVQGMSYKNILNGEWMDISRFRNGDILNRINNDTVALTNSVLDFFPSIVNNTISFIGALIIMLYYDPMMALIALISAPAAAIMSYSVIKKIRQFSSEMYKAESEKMSFTEDTVSNLHTVKAFGISAFFEREMQKYLNKCRDITIENSVFMVRCQNILAMIGIIATYSCYCFGVYRLWGGVITYGTMTLFVELAGRLRSGFSSLVNIVPEMIRTGTRASRIMELESIIFEESTDEPVCTDTPALSDNLSIAESIDEIVLDKVTFSYDDGRIILDNISFSARKGEIVALIGPSGGGKTTITRMLLGMIKPISGTGYIKLSNGEKIAVSANTRQLFSYVPQGNTLFAGTIAENLKMVKENATEDEMISALTDAQAWDFISKLDGGLNHTLGEHGKGLSEGQAQRISIARALIRNAPIILMDEATSALDPDTEEKILKRIMQADSGKIIIVTAHRKSVMDYCTRTYKVTS